MKYSIGIAYTDIPLQSLKNSITFRKRRNLKKRLALSMSQKKEGNRPKVTNILVQ